MKLEHLLCDVNLSEIIVPAASSKVILHFLNMSDGSAVGTIICSGVVTFTYQAPIGVALPAYVGAVTDELVSGDAASTLLQRLRYGFKDDRLGEPKVDAGEFHHVHIEGGIIVEIVCEQVQPLPRGENMDSCRS